MRKVFIQGKKTPFGWQNKELLSSVLGRYPRASKGGG